MTDAPAPTPRPARAARSGKRAGKHAAIARKELREVMRDGRFWMIAVIVAGLLVTALAFGLRQARAVHAEREAAHHSAEEHWEAQDDKNPHVAAHYGTYVFKPSGALPFIDPGIEPYVGVSVKLEAHRRNDMEAARAQDTTGLARFGGLSVASVLQLLVPLLIIGLGFSTWTAERERGTLRQIASLGVAPRVLVAGKMLGLAAALGALLIPALLLGVVAVAAWRAEASPTSGARLAAMVTGYVAYFAVFLGLTLAASARAQSSRGALVALLGFWVGAALIAPRAASDAAALFAPAPSHASIADAVRDGLTNGLPGRPPREERVGQIAEALLEEQGFAGAETLMDEALLGGVELQAEAIYENEVIDHHFARLADAVERQELWAQSAALLSPVVAIRSLSMAFAGTDYAHHRHFSDSAEAHRRALVAMLNREFAEKGGTDAWSYKAGRELWERAPEFRHVEPGVGWIVRRQRVSLVALSLWLVLGFAAAWRTAARVKVV